MTSTLFSRGGTSPRTTFPVPHDQTPSTYHCPIGLRHYYLSSDYLMSLDIAHGPISIFGPFIPTITPQNSTLLLLGKKGDVDFLVTAFLTLISFLYVQVSFQLQRSTLLTLRHPRHSNIYFIWRFIAHVLWCDGDPTVETFYGDLGGNSLAHFFPPYIYCLKT